MTRSINNHYNMLKFNSRTACIFKSQLPRPVSKRLNWKNINHTDQSSAGCRYFFFVFNKYYAFLFFFFFFFTATRTEKVLFAECKILQNYKLHPLRKEVTLIINMQ